MLTLDQVLAGHALVPLSLVFLAGLLGFTLKTITGLGFNLVFAPLVSLMVNPKDVVGAVVIWGTVLNLMILWETRGTVEYRRLSNPALGAIVGVPIGVSVLVAVSPTLLKVVMGTLVVVLALAMTVGFRRKLGDGLVIGGSAGLLAGVLHGVAAVGGAPIAIFLTNQGYVKHSFRGAFCALSTVLNLVTLVGMLVVGLAGANVVVMSLAMVPALFLSYPIGRWLVRMMSIQFFRQVTLTVIAVTGGVDVIAGIRELGLRL